MVGNSGVMMFKACGFITQEQTLMEVYSISNISDQQMKETHMKYLQQSILILFSSHYVNT